MYIRLNFGQHAGELQWAHPRIARELIASGRAIDPNAVAEEVAEVLTGPEVPAIRTGKTPKAVK